MTCRWKKQAVRVALAAFVGLGSTVAWPGGRAAAVAAPGAVEMSPLERVNARKAAQVDALRNLVERIYGLKLSAKTTVRDFVTQDAKVDTFVRANLRGVRYGEPRYFDDGTCEVVAEVTLEEVVTTIKRGGDEVFRNGRWQREQIDEITKQTDRRVLRAPGVGAARDERAGAPLTNAAGLPLDVPPIWKNTGGQARLIARRKAIVNGYELLNERLTGVLAEGGTEVVNGELKSDVIRTATEGIVQGARLEEIKYKADGTCEATLAVTLAQLVTEIHRQFDAVDRNGFAAERRQVETAVRKVERQVVSVVGVGALETARRVDGGQRRTVERIEGDTVIVPE